MSPFTQCHRRKRRGAAARLLDATAGLSSRTAGRASSGTPTRRGVATVELALVLPMLVMLLLIGMDYSRVFYASVIVANCARNGALWLCDPNIADSSGFETIEDAVAADATDLPGTLQVTTNTGTDSSGYDWSEVTVVYPFQTVISYPGIPTQVNISRTVRMRNVPDLSTDDPGP